jgi:hypothetical protein
MVPYTFTVIAVNALGPGAAATTTGQSAGNPLDVAAPTLTSDSSAAATRAVNIQWAPASANGKGPVTYVVNRTGGSQPETLCHGTQANQCEDDSVTNDGNTYTYSITATNFAGHSACGTGTTMEASATPAAVTNFTATPTGNDGEAKLTFDAPPSYGPQSTLICTVNGGSCGSWSFPTGGQPGATETIEGLPNGQAVTITLHDNNGSQGGNGAGSPDGPSATSPVTSYGPIRQPSITNVAVNGQTVSYTVNVDANGKSATVQVQSAATNSTYTVSAGDSRGFSDTINWSTQDNITVTVSDPGRTTMTATASASTGPAPPPPAQLIVSRGSGPFSATGCSYPCYYIHLQTINFPGTVTCTFNSSLGPDGFVTTTMGANQSKDSPNYFGRSGGWVQATCGSITTRYTWP